MSDGSSWVCKFNFIVSSYSRSPDHLSEGLFVTSIKLYELNRQASDNGLFSKSLRTRQTFELAKIEKGSTSDLAFYENPEAPDARPSDSERNTLPRSSTQSKSATVPV